MILDILRFNNYPSHAHVMQRVNDVDYLEMNRTPICCGTYGPASCIMSKSPVATRPISSPHPPTGAHPRTTPEVIKRSHMEEAGGQQLGGCPSS